MRKFIISAAALTAFAALLGSAPAKADYHFGGIRNGNQCWSGSMTHGRDGFGFWSACPQTASVATTRTVRRHHR